jgi:hypothetical protein
MRTTWSKFGPDPPITSLGSSVQNCLPPNKATAACDAVIGSAQTGNGFCANPQYAQTTYCSCVNSAVACPNFALAACANTEYSYKPWYWNQPSTTGGPSRNQYCAKAPVCVNLVEVGGSQNIVSGITQQCGTIKDITNIIKTDPTMAVLIFILFIALIIVATLHTDDDPPPYSAAYNAPPRNKSDDVSFF